MRRSLTADIAAALGKCKQKSSAAAKALLGGARAIYRVGGRERPDL
jgi:hypothetical protein